MGIKSEHRQVCLTPGEECATAEQQLQLVFEPVVVLAPIPITNLESQCLKELRKLIKEDEFVRETGVADDEELLLAFVRGKKCNPEKAFKTLQNHVNVVRVKYSKFFQNLSPRKWKYMMDLKDVPKVCGMLKQTDSEGRRVGVGRASAFNPRLYKVDDLIEASVTAGLELLRTEEAPRNGLVLIIDASGFGLRHAREFSMSRLYLFLNIFLSAYPIKYKGFHILNNAYLFDTILTIVKQLIPKKLRDRIHLHGSNFESLHKHVPREILPQTFGGLLSDEEAYDTDMEQRMLDRADYYEKLGHIQK